MPTTRLAPSPTGALHLGNARTFLINWLLARRSGSQILLRIEDIDGPRIKKGADLQAIDDLRWLGLDWDTGPIYQSHRRPQYADALQRLLAAGHAYPCTCTRSEVATAASAPHAEDGSALYPGTCRNRYASIEEAVAASGRQPAIRFAVPTGPAGMVEFHDRFAGHQSFNVPRDLGDFVIAKADGTPAYQLAVVVDDAEMGVTDILRGDDLLDSTPRQVLLYRALGMERSIPTYTHIPLVIGKDGRRLAKRHGDTRLSTYRNQNVPPNRLLQLLARWSGMEMADSETPHHLINRFSLETLPRHRITFTEADEQWLTQHNP